MKIKLIPGLAVAALAITGLTATAQPVDRPEPASAKVPEFALPAGRQPQFIVKFRDAKSLEGELRDIREAYRSSAVSAADLARLVNQDRAALESLLIDESRGRANRLKSALRGVNLNHDRLLATGADLVSIKLTGRQSIAEMKTRLEKVADVEYVEFNALMQPLFTPNDQYYNLQWHYHEATAGLRVDTAWDTATGTGARVAVLDTGYRPHVDLAANIIGGYDFVSDAAAARDGNGRDSNAQDEGDWSSAGECYSGSPASNSSWHGTHVAGTIAAVTNNSTGVAGVAYNAKVVPVRVLAKCGGTLADIADAIIWASGGSVAGVPANPNPADVINMSLGGGGACGSTYQNAINTAVNNGTVVVVAAGNENQNVSNSRPANCSSVVAVAASDRQGNRANYSNYGSLVDVTAPGGETSPTASNGVASTLNSGATTPGSDNYVYYQGTSMATPHVAGVAALMKGLDPNLTAASIESTLKSTARALAGSCSGGCGSGLVDAAAAVAAVSGGGGPPPSNELNNGDTVSNISGSTGNWQYWTIQIPAGASNLAVQISGGSGDADLYVRAGAQPTTSTYDCRPYLNGNNETCNFASPSATTYHIGIRAYTTFSGVTLSVNYTEPGSGGGFTVSGLSGGTGTWKYYTIVVPAGMAQLKVDISGGSGDADLYTRFGAQPTTRSYSCRPYLWGNNESCVHNNPTAGTWHIGIRAYSSYSGVTLDAYYTP